MPPDTASKETPALDDFDDLLDYDIDGDPNDPFSANYVSQAPKPKEREPASTSKTSAGLGIDEELDIPKKARIPRAKLDEDRLLSEKGIPKLRSRAKKNLKFKGKGHEYSDTARLLTFYQLWLDDLFPKAKFLDALAMVEKTGHKKRMTLMRMDWINEGKPRSSVHEDSLFDQPEPAPRDNGEREKTASRIAPIFEKRSSERPKTPVMDEDAEMEDLYDATPRAARQPAAAADSQDSLFGGASKSIFGAGKTVSAGADDIPDDDELDALLGAGGEPMQTDTPEEDELDALLNEVAVPKSKAPEVQAKPVSKPVKPAVQEYDDDDDDLDALLAEEEEMLKAKDGNAQSKAAKPKEGLEDELDEDEMAVMADMDMPW